MSLAERFTKHANMIVIWITLIGAPVGVVIWINENLPSKGDLEQTALMAEFRVTELQMSLNDYRIADFEDAGLDNLTDGQRRIYRGLVASNDRLNERREEIMEAVQ